MENKNIIIVNKPIKLTSNDVVQIIKKYFKYNKVGHAGTLDPFASGVLVLGVNEGTKELSKLILEDKEYVATIQFGYSTDTYDLEGKIIKESKNKVDLNQINYYLNNLMINNGIIYQTPPIYSAIKIDGKKLYEYARNNIDVDIKPRKVKINNYQIIKFDYNNQTLIIKLNVSKGFYIRSFANDIGVALNTYATLTGLIRTKSGNFKLEDCIDFDFSKYIK